jgi:5-formyltetrahydrofolate cyclo-ligase
LVESGVRLVSSIKGASTVGGYYPIRDEADLRALLQALHENCLRIALPRASMGAVLTFNAWSPGSPLAPGKFGVLEPLEDQPELLPDCVFVPLLAFDRRGNRLGYGRGYYDGALRRLRAIHHAVAIGIGFDEQEFPEIPRESQDEPMDMILTPTRVIACGDRHAASFSR